MTLLHLESVCKGYGSGSARAEVLKDISLTVEDGEFLAIVGFSGAGKTTLISLLAGLVPPDRGSIRLRGQAVSGPGPDRGVVFQNYSLMPWLSVRGNVALAVDSVHTDWPKDRRAAHVEDCIRMVGLSHAAERRPAELSGGMRQRVAVARALSIDPDILLLDEPLSALDALTRARLQDEIESIWQRNRKTVVLITNDVDEAILLADRIIPLSPGPAATLGPSFRVELPRPRDRTAINHDPEFIRLRAAVTGWLIQAAETRRAAVADPTRQNPTREGPALSLSPRDLGRRGAPPAAYVAAAQSPTVDRYVDFSRVTKVYPTPKGPLTVVDGFDLKLRRGEFISLIGHSGCGKSTVLTMAAGLTDATTGGIILDGREVADAGPDRAVVFQSPSLFPWLTAFENVAIGVDRVYPHASRAEREEIVTYYLARVGLGESLHRRACDLSNGMKQRVGIARAFALSPKLLLLDEPFGMLDSLTRWDLQDVLMEVWARTRVTAVCVTHDVDEAILLADRVVMMTNGPNARIGRVLDIDLPRPRSRRALMEHPHYYEYREQVLSFLAEYEHGATPHAA